MTSAEPAAPNLITFAAAHVSATQWNATTTCPHASLTTPTYVNPSPLDYASIYTVATQNYQLTVGCGCPPAPYVLDATVSFQPANGVSPGQQRYCPQQSASVTKNFFYGPGLTCSKAGAYQIVAKVQLTRSISQSAGGLGVLVISGVPILNVSMADESLRATANISTIMNLAPNQSINIGYENTSPNLQDVQTTTLTVNEVWVP